jgi:hypothetical protein
VKTVCCCNYASAAINGTVFVADVVAAGVDEEYHLYARHDKPSETLETDSKLAAMGHKNPVMESDAPANK